MNTAHTAPAAGPLRGPPWRRTSAGDLRDLREARTALRKGKLRPGDAQFDLVYARALATPKWYYSTKHLKEWRDVIEALMGESSLISRSHFARAGLDSRAVARRAATFW